MSKHVQFIAAIAVVALLILLGNTLYRVQQTEQALVVAFGKPIRIVQEPGLKFKKPFIEDVQFFDNRLLEYNADPKEVILGDQKRLIVDAYVRYRITDPLKFYQAVRDERIMRDRLNSIVESSLRQVMGSYPLTDVLSEKRAVILNQITAIVNSQASGVPLKSHEKKGLDQEVVEQIQETQGGFGVVVEDVRIMRADLPKENSEAIYRRMQTEREREAKEFRAQGAEEAEKIRAKAENERTVLIAVAQKEADITRGEGEAKSTKIFADAFGQDAEFFAFYRSLQAYRKVLREGDTSLILSPDSEFLKYMDRGSAIR